MSHAKFLAKLQNLNFWQFSNICYFDFVLFWHGIWCESVVWVIMGRRGVSQNSGVLVVLVIHIDGLVWKRHNSIANTLELRLFGTDPTISDLESRIGWIESRIDGWKHTIRLFKWLALQRLQTAYYTWKKLTQWGQGTLLPFCLQDILLHYDSYWTMFLMVRFTMNGALSPPLYDSA